MKNKYIVPFIISLIGVLIGFIGEIYQIIVGNVGWALILLFALIFSSVGLGINLIIAMVEHEHIKTCKRMEKHFEEVMRKVGERSEKSEKKEDPFEEFEEEFVGGENDKGTHKTD